MPTVRLINNRLEICSDSLTGKHSFLGFSMGLLGFLTPVLDIFFFLACSSEGTFPGFRVELFQASNYSSLKINPLFVDAS